MKKYSLKVNFARVHACVCVCVRARTQINTNQRNTENITDSFLWRKIAFFVETEWDDEIRMKVHAA